MICFHWRRDEEKGEGSAVVAATRKWKMIGDSGGGRGKETNGTLSGWRETAQGDNADTTEESPLVKPSP